jgi:hypothetical protein
MNQVTLRCPNCGAINSPESYFCNMCAANLRSGFVSSVQGGPDPWRVPLIGLCSALGVVTFFSLIANVAFLSQKPPEQNAANIAPKSLYQTPISSVTPLSIPSQTPQIKVSKSKSRPGPASNSQDYSIPSDEPVYIPTPSRSESRALPRSTPYPEPTQRYSPSYGRTYIRGPRGGCYYINGYGNKTYVDRSMCN